MFRKLLIRRNVLAAAGLAAALLMYILLASADDASEGTGAVAALKVSTIPAEYSSNYEVQQSYIGRVEARREAVVGFEFGGLVSGVLVDEGTRVAKGQVIARLDTALLRANRAELVAGRELAEANAELSNSTLERVRRARTLDAVSDQTFDEAERDAQANDAALRRAAATLRAVDVRIRKASLRAPFDATVAVRHVDEGRVIQAGASVLSLIERGRLDARIGVAGNLVSQLKVGGPASVQVNGRTYPGVVFAILPVRDRASRSVDAIVRLKKVDGETVRHGDLARLEIRSSIDEGGYWLPLTALTENARGLWAAYIAVPAGVDLYEIRRRELEVLHQETDRVFVRGTLQAGDRVVSSGVQRLTPGLLVAIKKDVGGSSALAAGDRGEAR